MRLIHWRLVIIALAPILFFGLAGFQPEDISSEGWLSIRLLTTMALLWMTEAIPLGATALLPVLVLGTQLSNGTEAIRAYANPIIFLFFGGFVLGAAIEHTGTHRWIAYFTTKFFQKRFSAMLGLMLGVALLSMWISNTAAALVAMPIALSMTCYQSESYQKFMILAVMYAASIGGISTLIGTPPNAIYAALMTEYSKESIGFLDWMLLALPISISLFAIVYLYLRKRCPHESLHAIERTQLSKEGKIVLIVFSLAAFGWIFQVFETHIVAVWAALLLFGLNVFQAKVLGPRPFSKIPLEILLLFGGGLSLGYGVMTTDAGTWLASTFFSDIQVDWVSRASVIAFATFFSELGSNTATANLMGPLILSISETNQISSSALLFPAIVGCSLGFMLPVSTPPNAIAYATGKIKISEMIRYGFIVDITGIIIVLIFSSLYHWAGFI